MLQVSSPRMLLVNFTNFQVNTGWVKYQYQIVCFTWRQSGSDTYTHHQSTGPGGLCNLFWIFQTRQQTSVCQDWELLHGLTLVYILFLLFWALRFLYFKLMLKRILLILKMCLFLHEVVERIMRDKHINLENLINPSHRDKLGMCHIYIIVSEKGFKGEFRPSMSFRLLSWIFVVVEIGFCKWSHTSGCVFATHEKCCDMWSISFWPCQSHDVSVTRIILSSIELGCSILDVTWLRHDSNI
jgi:hypothetical protein